MHFVCLPLQVGMKLSKDFSLVECSFYRQHIGSRYIEVFKGHPADMQVRFSFSWFLCILFNYLHLLHSGLIFASFALITVLVTGSFADGGSRNWHCDRELSHCYWRYSQYRHSGYVWQSRYALYRCGAHAWDALQVINQFRFQHLKTGLKSFTILQFFNFLFCEQLYISRHYGFLQGNAGCS